MPYENNLHLNSASVLFELYLVYLKKKLCLVSLAKFYLSNVKEKLINR